MSCTGSDLESAGWLQGVFVKDKDLETILEAINFPEPYDGLVAVVASQSCDIACSNLELAPDVELSIGRVVGQPNGNFSYNKNPRLLHTSFRLRTDDSSVGQEGHVEFRAFEKISISKEQLQGLTPDVERIITNQHLASYVAWLAARYSRPALPTAFNDRIAVADRKGRRKKIAKSADKTLSGIYVRIFPDEEIQPEEAYDVQLLGLTPSDCHDLSSAEAALTQFKTVMESAGMTVTASVRKESEVSLATIKGFKRFYFDDLSFKNDSDLPVETQTSLS